MNLSKNKILNPTPPEKGSFPLDHFDECGPAMKKSALTRPLSYTFSPPIRYMSCLQEFEGVVRYCEDEAKAYLQCRMDKGLMVPEPMTNLGFRDEKDRGD